VQGKKRTEDPAVIQKDMMVEKSLCGEPILNDAKGLSSRSTLKRDQAGVWALAGEVFGRAAVIYRSP
jgi:hypothetical protein